MIRSQRAKSFLISAVGGFTLFLLAVAVFSVAVKARSVSSGAEETVELVESLRVVSLSRSEMSTASRLSSVAPDGRSAIEAAVANSVEALDAARTALDDSASPELLDTFDEFASAVQAQGDLLLSGASDRAEALVAEAATGEAFDRLATSLRSEQEAMLSQLGRDNEYMNTIGTVATFIVAFVIPSAALYIFEALRRTPRHTREVELHAAKIEARSAAAAMALQQEIATMRLQLFGAGATPEAQRMENVRRSLLRLDNLATVNGAVHRWHSETVDVVAVAHEIRSSLLPDEDVAVEVDGEPPSAVGDPVQIAIVTNELVRNALHHGQRPVAMTVRSTETGVAIDVRDRGSGLTPLARDAIFLERDYTLRNNLASGRFGYGLFAARLAAQSMGADLTYAHSDGETTISLVLRSSTDAPTLGSGPAVGEELDAAA